MMLGMQANENIAEYSPLMLTVPDQIPATFEAQARFVLDRLCEGFTVPAALRALGMEKKLSLFLRKLKKDPELAQAYEEAKQAQAMAYADQVIDISDKVRDSSRARNMIESRKWFASKLDPKTFGDKLDVTIDQQVSIRAALDAAEARVIRPVRDLAIEGESQALDLIELAYERPNDFKSDTAKTWDAEPITLDDLLA